LGNFLLFYWIYHVFLWLAPLLQGPWFSGLVFWWSRWVLTYSFHSSCVPWAKGSSTFSLLSILSSSSAILSSTCSSLLEWPSSVFFVLLKGFLFTWLLFHSFFWGFSMSLFNSHFISCVVFFVSYIFFIYCPLFHFGIYGCLL
jgi:hypothetical protein